VKQPSFEVPQGHRRLGHRNSDIMWLNTALDEAEKVHVDLRRPADVCPDAWNSLSMSAKLALIEGCANAELGAFGA
jgi:hypothetical protein